MAKRAKKKIEIDDDEDDVDLSKIKPKECAECGEQIPPYRIYCLPETEHCVKCAEKLGPQRYHDPDVICAKSSPSGQNGFSPKS